MYNIIETNEAIQEVTVLAIYMIVEYKNHKAALKKLRTCRIIKNMRTGSFISH